MTALYPVAANAEAALSAPIGRALRERDARALAGGAPVDFRVETTGPVFATREAALEAFAGRIEDDRPGRSGIPAEDRYLELRQMLARPNGRLPLLIPVRPNLSGERRWPDRPKEPMATVWRISVAYWRLRTEITIPGQPRQVRRTEAGPGLGRDVLAEMARLPLRPIKPQQPLDVGLFEAPLPESPGRYIPDE